MVNMLLLYMLLLYMLWYRPYNRIDFLHDPITLRRCCEDVNTICSTKEPGRKGKMHLLILPLLTAGVPIALVVFVVIVEALRTYLKVGRIHRLISAIPEPPISRLKLLTIGHDATRLFVYEEGQVVASKFMSWRARHGPIFVLRGLFADPVIMLMSSSAISHVSIRRPANYDKTVLFKTFIGDIVQYSGLFFTVGAEHARLRKIVAPGMHHASLVSLSNVFMRHGERLMNRLAESVGKGQGRTEINILNELHIGTFAVIMDACFGDDVIPQKEVDRLRGDYFLCVQEPPAHMARRVLLQRTFSFLSPKFFGWQQRLKSEIMETLVQHVRQFNADSTQHSHEKAKQECDSTNPRANLLALFAHEGANKDLSEHEMVGMVLTFLLAGQLTTSVSLAWTLYCLATHPQWQRKLREELANWNVEEGIQALDTLPLLDRVVKESVRLYPPVIYTSRVAVEDDEIDGYKIPRGTVVCVPTFAMQHDETIWGDDAHEFNPDRWLDPEIKKNSMYFTAFWFGSHGCIGRRFAIMETKAFTAFVVKSLDVSVNENDAPPTISGPIGVPRNMKLYFHHHRA